MYSRTRKREKAGGRTGKYSNASRAARAVPPAEKVSGIRLTLRVLWSLVKWTFFICVFQLAGDFLCSSIVDPSISSPLVAAALDGDTDKVIELIKDGADPNVGMSTMFGLLNHESAIFFGRRSGLDYLGYVGMVIAFLNGGIDPDIGTSVGPFENYGRMVLALLEAGADPNLGHTFGPWGMLLDVPPLSFASELGNTVIINALLQAGANPNKGSCIGPFHMFACVSPVSGASAFRRPETVAALIRYGADPNRGTTFGPFGVLRHVSPLAIASRNNYANVLPALLNGGADPNFGQTWLSVWQEKPVETFPEIHTQLEEARVDFHKKIFIQTPYAT